MSKFVIIHLEEIEGKVKFYKLSYDDICYFDSFWEECEKITQLKKELIQIQTRMEFISNLQFSYLDQTKFKELKGRKRNDPFKDYEIKTKHLRVYFFKDDSGNIIVLGGSKGTQKNDIARMRDLKLNYFNQK